ncbi:MAG: protoheme farnesyltransferase [Chlamydiota bacterium]|jgi:protoheme IX farnesyltransferase
MIAIKAYIQLTKPGIIMGNALTAFAGFVLASKGGYDIQILALTLLGLSLVMAGGCIANNCFDKEADAKMARTQGRPLVKGSVSLVGAKRYAFILASCGLILLFIYTNLFATAAAFVGLVVYVLIYTPMKYQSVHATLIGSIAGATPPVVGYLAVTGRLDWGAFLLFAFLVFWQMPHFYAIALYRQEDYKAASVPVLPLVVGLQTTKRVMQAYLAAFVVSAGILGVFFHLQPLYWITMTVLCGGWLLFASICKNQSFARGMFIISLVVITLFTLLLPFCL